MSFVQNVHFELSNSANTSSRATPASDPQNSRQCPTTVADPSPGSATMELGTSTQRRVFDVAPLNVMGKTRKTAITGLIIGSNLVQVSSDPYLRKGTS